MNMDSTILSGYKKYINKIDQELDKLLNSRIALIEDIGNHALFGHGKRLRPLFFILSCRLCNYQEDDLYLDSTIFEYIHTASLLHDDVLDNAELRRNKPSSNNIWGNHAAVLEGDFLYSKSFSIAVGSGNLRFLKKITDTTTQMAEGQMLELIHMNNWDTTKEKYMEIIKAKTAVLMSAACASGAIISGAEDKVEQALAEFGMNMGIAFQLMDDLLDYTSSEEVFGKPVGKDLKEGKITLPLIYCLIKLDETERKRLKTLFKSSRTTEEDYRNLIDLIRNNGTIARIMDEAGSYVNKAAECLQPFPESPFKDNLLELNNYIVERKY